MANDNQRVRLDLALKAMADTSIENSEEVIIKIITSLEAELGDNQKTIAEELQKIARQIEHTGMVDVAMDFKQRTTSAMMRLSMERRRGLRPPAIVPGAGAPSVANSATGTNTDSSLTVGASSRVASSAAPGSSVSARSSGVSAMPSVQAIGNTSASFAQNVRIEGTQVEYLVHPSRDVKADSRAFCDVLKGQRIWESAGGNICAIKFSTGPHVIIVEEVAFTCSVVLSVSNFEKTADDLESQGYQIVGSVPTPVGSASVFASDCGSKFALIARK
ncbi:MAG: hypothetical protein K2Y39_19085 [Candidatus Obscuribacterales bacterium]|nr:hypothetical protein [Candidatus Obscuribacterales bacterium]